MKETNPLLERATLVELTEADMFFIAIETGISVMHIAFLLVAHQYQAALAMNAETNGTYFTHPGLEASPDLFLWKR